MASNFVSKSLTENYKKICKEYRTEPNEDVLKQLNGSDSGNTICNLSTVNMCLETCRSLGKYLNTDTHFTQLILTDCLLQEDALIVLFEYLNQNKSLKNIDLKGNNIKIGFAQTLSNFLKLNQSLKTLILEWNNIGIHPEVVSIISEGLATNTNLTEFIIRNNQISHVGCKEIATALKKNGNLKILDLRWNNIGLLGARALYDALKVNRSLIQLDLNGNNISIDVLNSIERALKFNCEQKLVFEEQKRREEMLKMGLKRVERVANGQMSELMSKLSRGEEKIEEIERYSSNAIANLQNVLDERLNTIKSLENRLELSERNLEMRDKQMKDLEDVLLNSKHEISDLRNQHLNILRHERDTHSEREEALLDEIRKLREEKNDLNSKISQTKENCDLQLQKTINHWQDLLNLNKQTTNQREKDLQNQMESEKCKFTEKLNEFAQKEIQIESQRKSDQIETEKLRLKLENVENALKTSQNELSSTQTEFKLVQQTQKDRETNLKTKYDEMKEKLTSATQNLTEISTKFEQQKHETTKLRHELASKNETDRTVLELTSQLHTAHAHETKLKLQCETLENRVNHVEKELKTLETTKNDEIRSKNEEIEKLKSRKKMEQEKAQKMAENEMRRVNNLRRAIDNYIQSLE